jgi:branched-chain amino acid transport system substrate-binding protein
MNKTSKIIIGIIVAIIVIGGIWYGTSRKPTAPTANEPIKIGFIVPLTGWGAYWGVPVKNGAELAAKELNSQGYNVVLKFEDTESDVKKAASAAEKLISIDKVDALEVELTGPSQAVAPIAARENKVMYFSTFDETPLSINPYSIKHFLDTRKVCKDIANYAQKNKIKVGYVGPNLPIVSQCLEELKKILGEDLPTELLPSPEETDYRTPLLKLKEKGVQMLVSISYENNYINILKQKLALKFNVPMFCTLAECYSDKVKSEVPAEAFEKNIVFDLKISSEFVNKYKNLYPNAQATDIKAAAGGYDAVYHLVRGFSKCPNKNSTCVIDAIINDKDYKTQIESEGVSKDRKVQVKTFYYRIENNELKPLTLD